MFGVISGVLHSSSCTAKATVSMYIYCNYLVEREGYQYIYFILLPPKWLFILAIM